jgi:hypothetical protein
MVHKKGSKLREGDKLLCGDMSSVDLPGKLKSFFCSLKIKLCQHSVAEEVVVRASSSCAQKFEPACPQPYKMYNGSFRLQRSKT